MTSATTPAGTPASDRLRLRLPRPEDAPFLAHLASPQVAGEVNFFPPEGDGPGDRLTAADVGAGSMLAELPDGTPVGDVSWFAVPYGPNRRSLAWRIGCTIDVPHRGRGHGSLAQRLLADHLFATTPSNRVEADTDVENGAEQRALEKAGFIREAVLRGAQYRGGRWHDMAFYARLRGDA